MKPARTKSPYDILWAPLVIVAGIVWALAHFVSAVLAAVRR